MRWRWSYRRQRALLPSWIQNAVHVLARTGGEWPRAWRLLPAHRARPLADLQRWRRGKPGTRRLLRARRLYLDYEHEIPRFRPGGRAVADVRRAARHLVRALPVTPVLCGRPDPQ